MKIIALSGKKQSGKTTAAQHLATKVAHYQMVNFADKLKQIVCDCLGAEPFEMELDEEKNRMLPCGKTVREALQLVGTDWFRNLDPLSWVRAYKNNAQYSVRTIITSDVRFPNEVKCIQELGGHVIRLLRAPFAEEDQHESETALDLTESTTILSKEVGELCGGLIFDAIIDNREMTLEHKNEAVWKLINEKKWL